ncbi:MAG: hypothetical protein JNM56_01250 [Planctomycetia bacterium]|nr:hypothetical protein [Planctomycetia bacterium]
MGFLSGRISYLRFRVERPAPKLFGQEQLDALNERAIGFQRTASKDGGDAGWIAGDDILDTEFELAKNIVNDALIFALRIDTLKLPPDLLRAYLRIELKALAAGNPSGLPSFRQKREAREAARERLELEAKDGRYTRRKAYPILWDRLSNTLLVASTAGSVLDKLHGLFQDTFNTSLTLCDAGQFAAQEFPSTALDKLQPSAFQPGAAVGEVAWVGDPGSGNYLGNEFLLWLWYVLDNEEDTLKLPDQSEATVMFSRTLTLECPKAVSGSESIRCEVPNRLPEARRAIQSGKLPRKAGLTILRHDLQYELTLQAENLGISGAKLPASEESDDRARLDERIDQLRQLIDVMDQLYRGFLRRRLGSDWPKELEQIKRWLQKDDRARRQAAG